MSLPRRLLFTASIVALVVLAFVAFTQFGTPSPEKPIEARLAFPSDLRAKYYTLPNRVGVWLVRQTDGTVSAWSATSPRFGLPVRLRIHRGEVLLSDSDALYDFQGTRVFGPAISGLNSFPLRSIGDDAFVIDDVQWVMAGCARSSSGNTCGPDTSIPPARLRSTPAKPRAETATAFVLEIPVTVRPAATY
jgi:hypothetical protein